MDDGKSVQGYLTLLSQGVVDDSVPGTFNIIDPMGVVGDGKGI